MIGTREPHDQKQRPKGETQPTLPLWRSGRVCSALYGFSSIVGTTLLQP